jgi:Asp-tRNA(Asn)/Glu-tRNA(Gln) amidotransferase A subunit family amidase
MKQDAANLRNRRRILWLALAGTGAVALPPPGRSSGGEPISDATLDHWCGFDERISERTLAEAEKLFGLSFTESERRLILGGPVETAADGFFHKQLQSLGRRRNQDFPNSLAPALTFDPRLPGVAYPNPASAIRLAPETERPLPGDATEIAFASVKQQARWLAAGLISSCDLTEIYLERIERFAGLLQCFVTVTPEIARAQADRADRERAAGVVHGFLHGIPYGLKDLFDTAGVRTTWGAEPFRDRIGASDSAVAERLQKAGAVMLGKTTLGALAWGEIWFGGETRNPWNPREGSSGSSAGSAAATAAGLCSFAIGTETLGSIVSPSDRTGIAGLRPTFGRVSRVGAMALCWSLDKIGPMCRNVEDTAIVLGVLNGFDGRDPSSIDIGFHYDGRSAGEDMVVGFDPRWFEGDAATPTDLAALRTLRATGMTVREIRLPELPVEEIMAPLHAESAAAFEELTLSGRDETLRRQIANAWPNAFRQARFFSAVDYVQADRLRRRAMEELHRFFRQVDVVLGPSFDNPMLNLTNFTGHPCLVMRAGFEQRRSRPLFDHPENDTDPTLYRVPRSVCLWGSLFEEDKLIRAGRALEIALGVTGVRPAQFATPKGRCFGVR